MGVNHYEALGVPSTAELAVIRRAYRHLARLTHPDRGGDAAEFVAVALAWAVLSDPASRAAHDAELAGDDSDSWGEEVGLDEPAPAPPRAAPPEPGAAPADRETVDPFTSPPRTLPLPDTTEIVRLYPRPVGGWALCGYGAATLLAVALAIAFPDQLPVSSTVFVGLLAYSLVPVAALALRALPSGALMRVLAGTMLYGVIVAFALGGTTWAAEDGLPGDVRGTRTLVVGASVLVSLTLATAIEVRRARARRAAHALRGIYDAAAAARRWNLLLHALHRTPGSKLDDGRASTPGRRPRRRPRRRWAVVDPLGTVHAAASDADLSAWCSTLRAAGVDVAPTTSPQATAAGRSTI